MPSFLLYSIDEMLLNSNEVAFELIAMEALVMVSGVRVVLPSATLCRVVSKPLDNDSMH